MSKKLIVLLLVLCAVSVVALFKFNAVSYVVSNYSGSEVTQITTKLQKVATATDPSTAEKPVAKKTITAYHDDEGVFEVPLNPSTVHRYTGTDSWTQQKVDYLYVEYVSPFKNQINTTNYGTQRLKLTSIKGFTYDPAYQYVLSIVQQRGPQYGVMDVEWYTYALVSIVKQEKLQ